MKCCLLAAGAVVSLCGTSLGFSFVAFGQFPNQVVTPSSGLFAFATDVNDDPVYSYNGWLLAATNTTWSAERSAILASSWIGIDANGGPGNWSLGTGAANRPAYSETNGNANYPSLQIGGPGFTGVTGGTAAALEGGPAGWGYAPQRPTGGTPMPGVLSTTNDLPEDIFGNDIDLLQSVYVGHFALTEQDAFLVGAMEMVPQTNDGDPIGPIEGFVLDLDGSLNYGFRLAQVRGPGNTIDLYVVEGIPTPGALAAIGLGAAVGIRRRR